MSAINICFHVYEASAEGPYSLYFQVYCHSKKLHSKLKWPMIFILQNSEKFEHELEISEKQVAKYIEWSKSDTNKRVQPDGFMRLGKSTSRKRIVHYKFGVGTGVLFRRIKQDVEGICLAILYYYFLKYSRYVYTGEYFPPLDIIKKISIYYN